MTAVLVESGPDKGAIWHFGEPNQEQKALAAVSIGASPIPSHSEHTK